MENEKTKMEVKKVDRKIVYKKPEVKKKFERTVLEPGSYVCEYLETKEVLKNDQKYYEHKWREITTNNWLKQKSATEFTPNSVLHKIFYALGFDLKEGQELNFTDLIGKKCKLLLTVKENTNKETGEKFSYNVIIDHIRMEQPQQSKPVQSNLQS